MAAFELAGANQSTFANEDVAAITGDRFVMAALLNEVDVVDIINGFDRTFGSLSVTVKDPFGNDLQTVEVVQVDGAFQADTGIYSDVELHGRTGKS